MSGLSFIPPDLAVEPIDWQTGAWYDVKNYVGGANTSAALTANRVYASPIWVPKAGVLDRIGLTIPSGAAASGKVARLMLALPTATDLPGELLLDAGTVAVDTTGDKILTIDQPVSRGLLYGLVASDGTPTVNMLNNYGLAPFGAATPAAAADQGSPYRTQADIVAPNPFGTPSGYANNVFVRIAVRIAS